MAPAARPAHAARRDRAGVAAAPRGSLRRTGGGTERPPAAADAAGCRRQSVEAARESAPKGVRIFPPLSLPLRLQYLGL